MYRVFYRNGNFMMMLLRQTLAGIYFFLVIFILLFSSLHTVTNDTMRDIRRFNAVRRVEEMVHSIAGDIV